MDLLIESAVATVAKPTELLAGNESPLKEAFAPVRRRLSSLSGSLSLCKSSTAETFVERFARL